MNSAKAPNGHTILFTSISSKNAGKFSSIKTLLRAIKGFNEAGFPAPKAPMVGNGWAMPSP